MSPVRGSSRRTRGSSQSVNRETFVSHWLTRRATSLQYRRLKFYPLREITGSRTQIRDSLSQAVVDHHMNRDRVADRIASLGFTNTAQFIESELPRDDRTRKGNFGEVVASEHLIQHHGFSMPVFKIRFRDSYALPMRGEDIVAFEMDARNRIKRVIIGEAKTIGQFRNNTVEDAHDRLITAYRPRPMTLSMLAEILYERGDQSLAREIDHISDRFMKRGFPKRNWIFLITGNQPRNPFKSIEERQEIVSNLNCVSLRLQDLSDFVHDLFDNPSF